MPLQHFSRSYPRGGQWVLVDGARVGIFCIDGKTTAKRAFKAALEPPADPAHAELWTARQNARLAGDFETADEIRTKLLAAGCTHPDAAIATVLTADKRIVVASELPSGKQKGTVQFVKMPSGENDGAPEQIEFDRLTPCTSRDQLPAERLAKMDPAFVPTP